ncbi:MULTISPECIES: DMT family transporter [Anaeromyxobacter]|uniref:DMT family transporter n=1 Tax=Anaeromyxobacter TaxID=161492 RepID=UPI001F5AC717|nr:MULTISPECIES: EamA family transporter [unclassified Anaeromyxobacter]
MRARIVLVYVAIAFLWGSTWSVIRVGLEHLPPLRFAGVRMALAAALLAPFALRGGAWRVLVGEAGPRIALVGIFQIALPYGLMFVAQQWVPSGLAALLFASFPVWIALLARVFLPGERLTPTKLASAALGVAGIAVLQAPHLGSLQSSGRLALGGALILCASIVVALANVLVRRHLLAVSPLAMTAGQTLVGAVVLLAAALALEHGRPAEYTPAALGALAYLAVFGTALTYIGLYWLVPRVPIAAIGALPLLDTTVAVTLGAVLLREAVGWNLALGGAMVLAAAALATRDAPAAADA